MKKKKTTLQKETHSSTDLLKLQPEGSTFYENGLFKGLQPNELSLLFNKMKIQTFEAGSIIFMPEDPACEKLYLLSQGCVEMYRLTANGKRLVTRHVSPGEIFGVRGLFDCVMQKNFAEAMVDSTVGVINQEQILKHLKCQPDLMLRILKNVCFRLYLLEDRLVETVYNPVRIRLAYFLMTNADETSEIINGLTHEEIGSQIGAVRQTVSETLGTFRKQGLIQIRPGQIRIIDWSGLEKIVQGSEK